MKRPPGLWCLLIIATFWLCIQDVDSLRATALILGKSPSTTTTTSEAPQEIDGEETVTEAPAGEESQNSTKPTLTGIPQIDYIYDPNLPRELNGYNLSEYPFYDRVPEDINFKCDGLHDGFYASVPHKCQVYHHCLYGVRYDFLCANYTAFDQKTFICHFVSEVDCVNSKKFWHRNDALYKAVSTTTLKPVVVYTEPPAPASPVPITPILNRRPGATGPGRGFRYKKPPKRYDYEYVYEDEDEEFEERRYKKRPTHRRPIYEDDDEEYDEEVYTKRRPSRRRPDRRGQTRRNKEERRRYEDDDYDSRETEDSRDDEEIRRPYRNRRPYKRRPVEDEDYDRRYERPPKRTRRPIDDDEYEDEPPARRNRKKNRNRDPDVGEEEDQPRKNKNEDRSRNEGRNNRNEERSRNNDERGQNNDERNRKKEDKPKSKPETKPKIDVNTEEPPLTKAPLSVYERKRPPKIRPPVPLSEQSKYAPKTTTALPSSEYEYYDDYEEEEIVKETKRNQERIPERRPPKRTYGKQKSSEYDDEEIYKRTTTTKRPQSSKDRRLGSGSRRRPVIEEYEDYEDNSNKSTEEPITTTTIKEIKEKQEPVVKVVKRPFLPSRGGNPYLARGLIPIGLKSEDDKKINSNPKQKEQENIKEEQPEESKQKSPPKLRTKPTDDIKPITNRPVSRINIVKITTTTTTTTTEKPIEKNPLDLDENEYDVTLNDALNPTIPNLPIRNFPTGFSSQNDYNYNTVQRSRYVADPTLNQASSDYVYRIEPLQSRYVPVYQNFRQAPRQQQAFYAGY